MSVQFTTNLVLDVLQPAEVEDGNTTPLERAFIKSSPVQRRLDHFLLQR